MTQSTGKRRVPPLLLAGMLALAVIGPGCALAVSQAFAGQPGGTMSGCPMSSGDSLSVCPFANPQQAVAPAKAAEPIVGDATVVRTVETLPRIEARLDAAGGFATPAGPGPLITPLRN